MSGVSPSQRYVEVHCWDTNKERCGHVSVGVGKEEAGNESSKAKYYHGMWPQRAWAAMVNPLTLGLFVPASSSNKPSECQTRESDVENMKALPDRRIKVLVSEEEYKEVKNSIKSEKENVQSGQVTYSLFANFNVSMVLNTLASHKAYKGTHACPFVEDSIDHPVADKEFSKMKGIRTENCTTSVIGIIQKGNIPVTTGYAPWGKTPTSLGDELEKLIKDGKIKGTVIKG